MSSFTRYELTDDARPGLTTSEASATKTKARKGASKGVRRSRTLGSTSAEVSHARSAKAATMRYGSVWNGSADDNVYLRAGMKSTVKTTPVNNASQGSRLGRR